MYFRIGRLSSMLGYNPAMPNVPTRRRVLALAAGAAASTVLRPSRATAAPAADFIRVSPRDPRYFETTAGRPYIPIGLNIVSPPYVPSKSPEDRLAALDTWLSKLSQNGGNHIRVWISNDFYNPERDKAGDYNEDQVKHIDAMLAMAAKHNIRVKMTIEHFREIDPANPRKTWALNTLHHTSRGGLANSMKDWLTSPAARQQFVRKLEFLASRYRDNPTIYGWELWNEMNAITGGGDYLAWTAAMLPELHRLFPHHLCMQSLGSYDSDRAREPYRKLAAMPGNDVAQVHRYLDPGAKLPVCQAPVDVLASDAVREILATKPGKATMLAESGAVERSHSGPSKLYTRDTAGIILHDVLFAPFFSGAAGSGQCWHWDHYVDKNDLWWHFSRFAAVVKDLDPPAESFEPITIDHPALRVYALKGRRTLLVWCRDKSNTWQTELADGTPPQTLHGLTLDLSPHLPRAGGLSTYDPWSDRWSKAMETLGQISLPDFQRSVVVKLTTPQ